METKKVLCRSHIFVELKLEVTDFYLFLLLAGILTFFISSVIHELALYVIFRILRPWIFILQVGGSFSKKFHTFQLTPSVPRCYNVCCLCLLVHGADGASSSYLLWKSSEGNFPWQHLVLVWDGVRTPTD